MQHVDVDGLTLPAELGTVADFIARLRQVTMHNVALARRFKPRRAPVGALFIRASLRGSADAMLNDEPEVWREHLGGDLLVHSVCARHQDLMTPAAAADIGRLISRHLASQRQTTSVPVAELAL